jgi:PII-like signaling protein
MDMKKKAAGGALKSAQLLRIFIGEADRWEGRPLYQAIVEAARAEGLAGASVFKGFTGYGRNSEIHTANLLRLSEDLPVVVEIVDAGPKLTRFLKHVDRMMDDGLVTIEKARVLLHRGRTRRRAAR